MASSPERRHHLKAEQPFPNEGQLPPGSSEPQAEHHTLDEESKQPEVHPPHVSGDIFQQGEPQISAPIKHPELQELQEGIPQELPPASEATADETPEQRRYRRKREIVKQLQNREAQGDLEAKAILDRRRAQVREAQSRWTKQHPKEHNERTSQWKQTEKGKRYRREYMREWRRKKKDGQ